MDKLRTASLVAALLISNACTEKSKPQELADVKEDIRSMTIDDFKEMQPMTFEEIPFPATKEIAKLNGFTDCKTSKENEYICRQNKNIYFEGFEFESAYVRLTTNYNLVDFDKTGNYSFQFLKQLQQTPDPSGRYSYRSIYLISKPELDPTCVKKHAKETAQPNSAFEEDFVNHSCSTGNLFLETLNSKGWLFVCEEGMQNECAYYKKEGKFRVLVSSNGSPAILNNKPQRQSVMRQVHLELEPLSPSRRGVDYEKAIKQQKLKGQATVKEQNFINSMKH